MTILVESRALLKRRSLSAKRLDRALSIKLVILSNRGRRSGDHMSARKREYERIKPLTDRKLQMMVPTHQDTMWIRTQQNKATATLILSSISRNSRHMMRTPGRSLQEVVQEVEVEAEAEEEVAKSAHPAQVSNRGFARNVEGVGRTT